METNIETGMEKEVDKPSKFCIVIRLHKNELAELEAHGYTDSLDTLSDIIAKSLRLSDEDKNEVVYNLKTYGLSIIGDYYYDIAKSKLFKLLNSVVVYKAELSDCIYAKIEGRDK